ncbi:hypothetical protein UY3_00175 [Chelonia mydas]|uniref:Uncharacterized protein n=1 Tax=Chelonia mydas TaxID=8469 RepID=M7BZB6_CHEMY|nr:hypothetical protein UY3_00175 [Chelonia mydas]
MSAQAPLTDLPEVGQEHTGDDDDDDNDCYLSYCTVCCHKAMSCCCVAMQYRVCQHLGHVQCKYFYAPTIISIPDVIADQKAKKTDSR